MVTLKCRNCGRTNQTKIGEYQYKESGLDNVILRGIKVYECSCGNKFAFIPRILELHKLIAKRLVQKKALLTGKEIRFLRKNLGLKAKDFAKYLRITQVSLSRWETGQEKHSASNDMLIRLIYAKIAGLDAEISDTLQRIEDIERTVKRIPYSINVSKPLGVLETAIEYSAKLRPKYTLPITSYSTRKAVVNG